MLTRCLLPPSVGSLGFSIFHRTMPLLGATVFWCMRVLLPFLLDLAFGHAKLKGNKQLHKSWQLWKTYAWARFHIPAAHCAQSWHERGQKQTDTTKGNACSEDAAAEEEQPGSPMFVEDDVDDCMGSDSDSDGEPASAADAGSRSFPEACVSLSALLAILVWNCVKRGATPEKAEVQRSTCLMQVLLARLLPKVIHKMQNLN